ncbi:nucleic acid-binding [Micractinium conductrix]|uniref:Nucleic acid-binding n=1 Tax=Micractinium conductrix TaxID=554055 RepID=A0A2P6V182_9CHLO|nr:nucleic acid-binding [Micractinium conductrix]|eukprot:PSC67857.1 nucleic acid-binding [Micractinium conductrix]
MPQAFQVPDEATARLLRLVAGAAGLPDGQLAISVGGVDEVIFSGPDGAPAFGAHTACRLLASLGPAELLGATPEHQAKVAEWVSFRHKALTPLMDAGLAELNATLAGRTYIAGGRQPSLADLALYAAVSPAAVAFPVAQHGHFCNLLRWYDLLHHTADAAQLFPAASFQRPAYVAPPPPPPAEPKAGKADKAAGAAAADKGAANGGDKAAAAAAAAAAPAEVGKKGGKAAAAAAAAAPAEAGKKEKGKKDKGGAPATPATSAEAGGKKGGDEECTIDLLDIRVGQIVKVGRHPNADALYLEEIDVGEAEPRQVISGLVKFVPEELMAGRRVLVVCNFKPAKMRDVMSYGMVLCASNDAHDQVDPVVPPEGVPVGERVAFEGYAAPPPEQLNPKKKQWEKIAPEFKTDAAGLCVYRGVQMMTSKGAARRDELDTL